jgi:hypothetical protein
MGRTGKAWVLTFDALLSETDFVKDMREILRTLHEAYEHAVDVEFTLNFVDATTYRIHVVQCRPLGVKGTETPRPAAMEVRPDDVIIEAGGAVIGQSRRIRVDRFVYVVPEVYGRLALQDRYEVARLIGKVNRTIQESSSPCTMLLGPGRWGTSDPFLGIPVAFAEINRVCVLCEIVAMREHLVPDVSLGTHFLNELVETEMLYLAMFPQQGNNALHAELFEGSSNRLVELVPDADKWTDAVKVVDASAMAGENRGVFLDADAFKQKVICYFQPLKP